MGFFKYAELIALFQLIFTSAEAQIFGGEAAPSSASFETPKIDNPKVLEGASELKPTTPAPVAVQTVPPANNNAVDMSKYNLLTQDQEKEIQGIFFYYDKFKVVHMLNGMTRCSVRLVLYTTLPEKLTNVSMRLQWPEVKTTVAYESVMPQKEYYRDYAFFGDGCYSMDKLPNITVNRCRLKGKTQKECASLVRLTTEANAPFKQ